MSEKHAIEMTFCGASAAEVTKHIVEFATLHGSPLANTETETLVKELRDRLAKNGHVVKIVPFSNEENSSAETTVEPTATPRRPGRPRKQVEEPAKTPDVLAEAEKTIAESVTDKPADAQLVVAPAGDGATVVEEVLPTASIDEVKRALNEFAAQYGQVEARAIMQREGGSPALKDVPAGNYAAVIAGLRNFNPVAMAA